METSDPALLRDLLKAAKIVNEEHDIRIGYDGIELRTMDPSHEYMIDLFIPDTFFDRYQVHEDQIVRFDLKEILRLVFNRKRGKLKDSTLEIKTEDTKIDFQGSGKLKGCKTAYLLEPEDEEIPVPRIFFKTKTRMLSKTLKRIVGDCDLHELVLVTVDPERILFQNADGYGRLAENEVERWDDSVLDHASEGEQVSSYKVEYLADLMKVIKKLSEVVVLELSDRMPMRITAELPGKMRLAYYVAPKVDIEDVRKLISGCYRETEEAQAEEEPEEVPMGALGPEAIEPPVEGSEPSGVPVEDPQAIEAPVEEAAAEIEDGERDNVDIYQGLEDLGYFAYSGSDGDLYRKHGLPGWRVSIYWGALVRIQRKDLYWRGEWGTVRQFGIEDEDGNWTPETEKALETVKELIERGTLEEEPEEEPQAQPVKTYDFYEDPGHGWMKVPIRELEELGIEGEISIYSHVKGDYAYLEEDCDAPLFIKATEARGYKVEYEEHTTNRESRIRDYPPYGPEPYTCENCGAPVPHEEGRDQPDVKLCDECEEIAARTLEGVPELPQDGGFIDLYEALRGLGLEFYEVNDVDGNLFRIKGLPGFRVSLLYGEQVKIQRREKEGWTTIGEYFEPREAIEAVKELIEKRAPEPEPQDIDQDMELSPEEKEAALETMIKNYNTHVLGRQDELSPEEIERLINIDIIDDLFPEEKPPKSEDALTLEETTEKPTECFGTYDADHLMCRACVTHSPHGSACMEAS